MSGYELPFLSPFKNELTPERRRKYQGTYSKVNQFFRYFQQVDLSRVELKVTRFF